MANLLERSSLVLTPTAYNNGEALCIKPDDASGDFDFSRNSAATRVNAQGLVENVQILSSNLVQNGDFSEEGVQEVSNGSFTNGSTDWTLAANWSIAEDKATSNGTSGNLYQSGIIVTGKQYKIQATVSDYVSGTVQVSAGAVPRGTMSANGTYTFYQTASSTSGFFVVSNIFNGSITNISVKEVGMDWVLNAGWEIGNNVVTTDGTINSNIYQNAVTTIGQTYTYSFDVLGSGVGVIDGRFRNGGGFIQNFSSEGTYTGTFVAYNTLADFTTLSGNTASFSITNISVIEISTDTNLPRISYENFSYDGSGNIIPNSGCGSWLFEPQSTNLITYSNDYADAYWVKATSGSGIAPIVTSNYAISPDGTQNADRIQFNATTSGSNSDRSRLRTTLTLLDVTDYTFSFYAKSTDGTDQQIGILFDNSQISLKTITSEWQRFEATAQQFGTSSICGLDLRGGIASTSDILVYGIQIEQQSYATSYIPTNGEANGVTRNQDVCTNGGSLASINSTEGTLYFEGSVLANTSTFEVISLSDGSLSNILGLVYRNVLNQFSAVVKSGGSTSLSKTITLADATDNIKVAVSYKLNDFRFYLNGVLIIADTSGNTPIGLNTLHFADGNGTSNKFFGKTKALAVWKEALSDSELQSLTTI